MKINKLNNNSKFKPNYKNSFSNIKRESNSNKQSFTLDKDNYKDHNESNPKILIQNRDYYDPVNEYTNNSEEEKAKFEENRQQNYNDQKGDFWEDMSGKNMKIEDNTDNAYQNQHSVNKNIKPFILTKSNSNTDFDPDTNQFHYESMNKKMSKRNKSEEHGLKLYEKGKLKIELSRLLFTKNMELKIQEELKDCTFKPKLNKPHNLPKEVKEKLYNNIAYEFDLKEPIYYRQAKWKSRSLIKSSRMKNSTANNGYSYRPNFSNSNLNNVFEDKGFGENLLVQKHLARQYNARYDREVLFHYNKEREAISPNQSFLGNRTLNKSRIVSEI